MLLEIHRTKFSDHRQLNQKFIASLKDTVFGKVHIQNVDESLNKHLSDYECAAWSMTIRPKPGVYDIKLGFDPTHNPSIYFFANASATIVSDFFPSLFCGNLIGGPYDSKQNAGKDSPRPYKLRSDVVETIVRSCDFGTEYKVKWAIYPKYWQIFLDLYRAIFAEYVDYMQFCIEDFTTNEDTRFESKLSQVAYTGGILNQTGDNIQRLKDTIRFRSESSLDYFEKNNPFIIE